jgi:hypothetical protein
MSSRGMSFLLTACLSEAVPRKEPANTRLRYVARSGRDLIRNLGKPYSVPGIAISGHGMKEDVESSELPLVPNLSPS